MPIILNITLTNLDYLDSEIYQDTLKIALMLEYLVHLLKRMQVNKMSPK